MDNFLNVIPKEVLVFAVSMVPVVELRGTIPVAIALDMEWWKAFFLCVFGNLVPVPFVIAYMKPVFAWIKRRKVFVPLVERIERRTQKKADKVLERYSAFALFTFVAIPLPGTGAWTGAMIAAMLGMRIKHAFLPIALGVVVAGMIMTLLSYHLI